jgi:hypothetical protein
MPMFSMRSPKAMRVAVMAGAVAAACALAAPAAYAGTKHVSSAPSGQTVNVVAPMPAGSGCSANIPGPSADHNHERIDQWWYLRSNGCVGTVITTTYVAAGGHCVNPQLKVNNTKFKLVNAAGQKVFFCPNTTQKVKVSWPVHETFSFPITVKAIAEFKGGGGELGPAVAVVH